MVQENTAMTEKVEALEQRQRELLQSYNNACEQLRLQKQEMLEMAQGNTQTTHSRTKTTHIKKTTANKHSKQDWSDSDESFDDNEDELHMSDSLRMSDDNEFRANKKQIQIQKIQPTHGGTG